MGEVSQNSVVNLTQGIHTSEEFILTTPTIVNVLFIENL